jgi:four helix bundle protein
MPIQSYRDLQAWQLGMNFVVSIYKLTSSLPAEERYGLVSQLRRAAVSIPSNVSEGHQFGGKAYRRYVSMALGSLAEANTQLEIALRLRLVTSDDFRTITQQSTRVRQVLHGLRRSLSKAEA